MMYSTTTPLALKLLICLGLVTPSFGVKYAKLAFYSSTGRCTAGTPMLNYKWVINDGTCVKDAGNAGTTAEAYKATATSFKYYTDAACSAGEVAVTATDTCTQLESTNYYFKVVSFDSALVGNGELTWYAYSADSTTSTCAERLAYQHPHNVCLDNGDGTTSEKYTCTSNTAWNMQAYTDVACATPNGAANAKTQVTTCTVLSEGNPDECAAIQAICTIPPQQDASQQDSGVHAAPSWMLVSGLALFSQAIATITH